MKSGSQTTDSRIDFETTVRKGDFEFWRANAAPYCDITAVQPKPPTDFFEASQFFSGNVFLNHCQYGAKSAKHTHRHTDQIGGTFRIQRFHRGGMMGNSGDTPFHIRPGMIAFMDQACTFEALHAASAVQGAYIPRSMLDLDGVDPTLNRPLTADTTLARLIHAELDNLYNPLLAGDLSLPAVAFERFLACVKMAIHEGRQDCDIRAKARDALFDLICQHIERHLASPELGTNSLLKEFGVSRASLYRMFENDGGVRNYISTRRLFRAVHMISTNPLRRGQVTEAAERWGFNSAVSFNRSVKRTFGTSPGALFQQPIRRSETPLYSTQFARYISRVKAWQVSPTQLAAA